MNRFVFVLWLLLAGLLHAQSEPPPRPGSGFRLGSFRVRPNSFSKENPTGGERTLLPGVKRLPEDMQLTGSQLDVRDYFQTQGVPFAEGSEAIYDDASGWLLVRAAPESFDRIAIVTGTRGGFPDPLQLQIELLLVEFAETALPELSPARLNVETLRKAAGDSWHVLDRIVASAKSGQKISLACKSFTAPGGASKTPAPDAPGGLAPGEMGSTLDVESVIGPDTTTIDTTLTYHHRGQQGVYRSPLEWHSQSDIVALDGQAQVLQSAPAYGDQSGQTPARQLALIFRATVIDAMPIRTVPSLKAKE